MSSKESSGGEPTIHPQFFEIMDAAQSRPIKHLMLNTNGLRIANEPGFAQRLASYLPRFEVYLQWDSMRAEPLRELRGAELLETRHKADRDTERPEPVDNAGRHAQEGAE
ncbi:MAG: hypothetical protein V9E86_07900 [Nitrosomonas sp.]